MLNSSDEDFVERLRDACREHDCHLAFDAVAGTSTHQLLDAMPDNSKVTVFSGLSKQAARAGIDHLVFEGKSVDGFWLGPWVLKKNPLSQSPEGRGLRPHDMANSVTAAWLRRGRSSA